MGYLVDFIDIFLQVIVIFVIVVDFMLFELFKKVVEFTEISVDRVDKLAIDIILGNLENIGVVREQGLSKVRLQLVLDFRPVHKVIVREILFAVVVYGLRWLRVYLVGLHYAVNWRFLNSFPELLEDLVVPREYLIIPTLLTPENLDQLVVNLVVIRLLFKLK